MPGPLVLLKLRHITHFCTFCFLCLQHAPQILTCLGPPQSLDVRPNVTSSLGPSLSKSPVIFLSWLPIFPLLLLVDVLNHLLYFFFTFLKLPGKKMMILLTTVPPEARIVLGTEQALYKPWLSKKMNKQAYHLWTHTQRCQLRTGHINSWRATAGRDIESQCNWQVTAAASCSDSVSEKQGRLAKGTEGLSPSTRHKCPGHRAWSHPSRMGPWRGPSSPILSSIQPCPSASLGRPGLPAT